MTRQRLFLLFLFIGQVCFSQGFRTLDIEKKNVDSNNEIFKIGKSFVYDYEIIENGDKYKINHFEGIPPTEKFELVKENEDTLGLKIHLLVPKIEKSERTDKNQTEIYYLYAPIFTFMDCTGIVDNQNNIWIHPPRTSFFRSLETCPFPYIKLPIEIGKEWKDKMEIGNQWSNELWGDWNKKLLLSYDYRISKKTIVKTGIGDLECYVVESTAKSEIGISKLTTYYSELYGFVRLEYEMVTGLKVNLWLDSVSDNDFNDQSGIIKYREEQIKTVANKLGIKAQLSHEKRQ